MKVHVILPRVVNGIGIIINVKNLALVITIVIAGSLIHSVPAKILEAVGNCRPGLWQVMITMNV